MQSFRCIIARTAREIEDAQRLRWRVYGDEESLLPASICDGGREIDARDFLDSTVHFLIYAGQDPVGTVRLLQSSAEETRHGRRLGLDLESKCDLGALSAPGIVAAEVTRYCVLREYRSTGVTSALFSALFAESSRRGITHWVAGANMETDCAEDAVLAYRVAREKRLVTDRSFTEPRAHELPETPRRRPYYTPEQRSRGLGGALEGIPLPRTLSLFAKRMGARFIGSPVYDAYFNVFALPLIAALADIGEARSPLKSVPSALKQSPLPHGSTT
jgi:putative hemolysin